MKKKSEKKDFLDKLKHESKQSDLQCEVCDECSINQQALKNHIVNYHMKCFSTQTESEVFVDKKIQVKLSDFNADKSIETLDKVMKDFEHYQCHYCGFEVW